MVVVEFIAAFYGIVILYGCVHVVGQWIADHLDAWATKRGELT